ncbi:MAG: transcription termination factor NusA [Bacteroidales bacterium]|jgi:N utilization substance protein A|nr:transcription termination factor NusA [Bacteroidales bacterium]
MKQKGKSEDRLNLIETFAEFKELKNIERETMMSIVNEAFRSMLIKKYGNDAHFEITVNVDHGDLEIQRFREIVEDKELTNENTQIALSEAIKIEPDFEVGEEVGTPLQMKDFQRREILTLRQTLSSRIIEQERDRIFKKYENREGELVVGEINQIWKKEILVQDDEGVELVLSKSEQIPTDRYKKGDSITAMVLRVEMRTSNPHIMISRTSPTFLERLMEQEIPEIYDGLIMIKNVVRSPGEKAKVLVESYDDRIDPVGACVGVKGSRIYSIVQELRGENIDIINYTSNQTLLIARSLSPAKVSSIEIDEENKTANVYMKPDQVSLAIGKGGYNIKLASKLVGYEIDVFRDDIVEEEDVDLNEFEDEFDQWVIDSFKKIGCDTAKSVLSHTREELIQRTDLEEETVDAMISSIKKELEME